MQQNHLKATLASNSFSECFWAPSSGSDPAQFKATYRSGDWKGRNLCVVMKSWELPWWPKNLLAYSLQVKFNHKINVFNVTLSRVVCKHSIWVGGRYSGRYFTHPCMHLCILPFSNTHTHKHRAGHLGYKKKTLTIFCIDCQHHQPVYSVYNHHNVQRASRGNGRHLSNHLNNDCSPNPHTTPLASSPCAEYFPPQDRGGYLPYSTVPDTYHHHRLHIHTQSD